MKNKKVAKRALMKANKIERSVEGTVTQRVASLEEKSHTHANLTDLNNLSLTLLLKFSEVDGKLYFDGKEVAFNVSP